MPTGDGPFQIHERINDNAHKLDLPDEYGISATFNVSELNPFDAGDNFKRNPSQEDGNDENIVPGKCTWDETYSDVILVPIGPVTWARAKKFKDALMGLIRASWSQANAWRPTEGITYDSQPDKCVIQVLEGTEKSCCKIATCYFPVSNIRTNHAKNGRDPNQISLQDRILNGFEWNRDPMPNKKHEPW